ncbi:YqaJ viral recombinase family nuclease [Hespellia stercorisuis]|uniref:Putative phage-type endonuclease n=1 Tax=Hespellia stercorisuis DSM 15480 TaxID=1121950 RepID=A0A1M6U2M0_9FIRM|nr:YqaJ viral recombinase family protein [Hespellia stercorisuis]SHK63409.1 putative phage-type endonuclease [Hespellia stercorisuis DSM 15480]
MKKLVSTLGMAKEEWLQYRKRGIGGSDAGAICGLNPYRTAMEVYQEKISDDIDDLDNEAMRQGREFEEYVARRFTELSGKKVRRANAMFCHEKYPFMLADVDRLIVGENAGLECKTASPYMADKWKDGNIPLSYQLQCHHYMAVCNTDAWYIAVLIFGREFKFCKIERDEEIIADLIRVEKNFWENHVLSRKMPSPDGSKIADSVIAEYYNRAESTIIPLTGFNEKLKRRQELQELIGKMDTEKRFIEQKLKVFMGTAEEAENEQYRVTWKNIQSNRLDEKRLKVEKPEVYQEFLRQNNSRRLVIKAA